MTLCSLNEKTVERNDRKPIERIAQFKGSMPFKFGYLRFLAANNLVGRIEKEEHGHEIGIQQHHKFNHPQLTAYLV